MPKRPNLLIFMTDHQRGDTVLPEHPCLTPNVEKLAREGVTFSETFCPSPHCCPSRATFFTGLYPTRHGVWNNVCNDQALSRGLKPGVRVFSEELREAGYRTVFDGKWHVSVDKGPADYGWEETFVSGGRGEHHGVAWEQWKNLQPREPGREREHGEILRPGWGDYTLFGKREEEAPAGHDERVVEHAVDLLPRLARGTEPWCLFVGLIGPHDPYQVHRRYVERYRLEDIPLPPSYCDNLEDKTRVARRMRRQYWSQLSETEVRDAIRHFWASCTYLDELFGQVMQALDSTGQAEDTMVVYLSDHGDYCGDHGLFLKGIPCFRGAYHVPCVVRWPKVIANPGRRTDRFVTLADFAPTFVEASGAESTQRYTGRSILPLLQGEVPSDWPEEHHSQCNGVELYYTQRSVATHEWKYVYNGFDEDELYNLNLDPHEMRNLSADPSCDAVKREMAQRMWCFAYREEDAAMNPYGTVALCPWGPGEAFPRLQ
ncbi:MAG: sulfatase-like hydrolase/transferase [Armatimonadetes bacterium]|nr:sulfatase-like hydrolase/transferase [Armatimonadota bacterium]